MLNYLLFLSMVHEYAYFLMNIFGNRFIIIGNSSDKLRHPRSDAYSAEQVLLHKQQIWGGGACLDC